MLQVDWAAVFLPSVPWAEIIVRGSLVYWFIFLLFRVVLRRDTGDLGVADMLLIVLIADAAQNAMSAEYRSFSDGAVLISTLVFWSMLIDYLCFRFPLAARLLEPKALPLIREGRVMHRNLRREFITAEELQGKLREQGVESVAEVKLAMLESGGAISVIKARKR